MPQLDFFIYPHIVIQSTIIFLILAIVAINPLIILFKNLRVRYKFSQMLIKDRENNFTKETDFSSVNVIMDNVEKEINGNLYLAKIKIKN